MEEENKKSLTQQEKEGIRVIGGSDTLDTISHISYSQMGEQDLLAKDQFHHQENEKEVNTNGCRGK